MRKALHKIDYFVPLHAENYYHVYNRANGKEMLFRTDDDRRFFLKQYDKYLSHFLKTFVYQLLGNHFHLVVQVESVERIAAYLQVLPQKELTIPQRNFLGTPPELRTAHSVLENQFLRLFTSYAMRFNKIYERHGNLFHRPFKRVTVNSEGHFGNLIKYVHTNCRKHGLQQDFFNYPWSSYPAMISTKPTRLERAFVLDWFGGLEAFVKFHQRERDNELGAISNWVIEED